jgi:16S rRNA (cytidine1402-2'-O)-methyltransferase
VAGERNELTLVATPIGNLGDLSPRAIEALAAAALICCEDTRRTGRLLQAAGVTGKRLAVCNEHTERRCVADVLAVLADGGRVALVTDAGTPGISDPGELLVGAVLAAGYEVSTVPGPTAFVAALVSSGLPTTRFVFEGFLPRSGATRRDRLGEIAAEPRTVVLYEAPHRVVRTIRDLTEVCGPGRPVTVARELTKRYESVVRGTLGTLELGDPRGEYVIVLGGAPAVEVDVDDEGIAAAIDAELAGGASTRDAAARAAAALGVPRRRAYDIAVRRSASNQGESAATTLT